MTVDVRFSRPPVRDVTLTIRFALDKRIQVSHLAGLREQWRSDFPETEELAPRAPINATDDREVRFIPPEGQWPFPELVYSNPDNGRRITVQQDRFALSWTFQRSTDEQQRDYYPGYLKLREDLRKRFELFQSTVSSEASAQFVYSSTECKYENVISGYSSVDFAVGILTGWRTDSGAPAIGDTDYSGIRLHQCANEESRNCSVLVGVDGERGSECQMFIEVERDLSADEQPFDSLDIAHDALITTFLSTSNESLKNQWGQLR